MHFSHPVAVFASLLVLSCILIFEKFRNFGKERSILSILEKKESGTGKIVMQLHFDYYHYRLWREKLVFSYIALNTKKFRSGSRIIIM